MRLLLGKMLIHDPARCGMHPRIGNGRAPFLKLGVQIVQIAEAAPEKEVLPDIAEIWANVGDA
ncbi:hypothetical protein [Paracoccus fontiphilus]|uniref:hypothetical protein n=1 Tax=Paracoccus fontiphilus TaxID=1815556 RepID=UPI003BFA39D9